MFDQHPDDLINRKPLFMGVIFGHHGDPETIVIDDPEIMNALNLKNPLFIRLRSEVYNHSITGNEVEEFVRGYLLKTRNESVITRLGSSVSKVLEPHLQHTRIYGELVRYDLQVYRDRIAGD